MGDCKLINEQIERFQGDVDSILEGIIYSKELVSRKAGSRSNDPGPFDYVSLQALAEWWFDHGAVVGQRHLQFIKWFDGTRTEIVEPA